MFLFWFLELVRTFLAKCIFPEICCIKTKSFSDVGVLKNFVHRLSGIQDCLVMSEQKERV